MHLEIAKTLLLSILTTVNCAELNNCERPAYQPQEQPSLHVESPAKIFFDPLARSVQLTPKDEVKLSVPFSSQAPFSNWLDPYDEACEETSVMMVEYYLRRIELTKQAADIEITSMVEWQRERGFAIDISAADTAFHARNFYNRNTHLYYESDVTIENIKKLLSNGFPVIIPAAGRTLANPNFQGNGPPYHMIVLTGYDSESFFANDPGTQFGAHYRYSFETIDNAIHDWTGSKNTVEQGKRAMLVITI